MCVCACSVWGAVLCFVLQTDVHYIKSRTQLSRACAYMCSPQLRYETRLLVFMFSSLSNDEGLQITIQDPTKRQKKYLEHRSTASSCDCVL